MRHAWLAVLLLLGTDLFAGTVTINGNSYTYTDHPRLFLDGPAGTITTRVKDPDGAGAGVAPQATDDNPAFVALKVHIRSCVSTDPPCDTEAPNESPSAARVAMAALDWYMDNSQTNSLRAAKYWLNKAEEYHDFGYACDVYRSYCGRSKHVDTGSNVESLLGVAYTLIRSEMSAGERTAFSQKMLNDVTNGYEDGTCTNQLQPVSGAVANYTSGASIISGSGFSSISEGHLVYVKASLAASTGGWAVAQTVTDSQITLTTPLKDYEFIGNWAVNVSSGVIFEVKDWTSTTCGFAWFIKHHVYNRRTTFGRYATTTLSGTINSSQETVTVAVVGNLPAVAPYYIKIGNEILKVTDINGSILDVSRAQFGTTAASAINNTTVAYNRYYPLGASTTDVAQNLVATKNASHLAIGLALLDDSAVAEALVEESVTGITEAVARNKEMWTGFTQAGNYYQISRQANHVTKAVMLLKQLAGAPSLDYSSGNWLKYLVYHDLYGLFPDDIENPFPWGQSSVAGDIGYYNRVWGPVFMGIYPGSTEAAYWNYWQRSNGFYDATLMSSSEAYRQMILYSMLYLEGDDDSTDYTAVLPTQRAFTELDATPNKAINAWVSRTGWTDPYDTLLFAAAYNKTTQSLDHMGAGAPAAYKIYKNGFQLTENYSTDTGEEANTNIMLFGSAASLNSSAAGQVVTINRSDSGTGWALVGINAQGAYTTATAVTRALRTIVHFKKAASPDYVVVHSDMATSSAKALGMNLYFDKSSGETSTLLKTVVAPSLTYLWTGPNRRLSTRVVLPASTAIASMYTSTTNAHQEYLCASSEETTCASATSAEFLLVHKPSTNTSDTLPTTAALGTIDSDFVGVQISDATAPSVAVFAKAGVNQTSATFTTNHSGTGQYVVTGLEAGTYDVVRGGATTVVDDEVIGSDGTIGFESVAGAFAITRGGAAPAIEVTTTTLSNATRDQAYSATLEYTGGTPPVTWTVSAGALCTGLSLTDGVISGTPTVTETCSFTVEVEDDAAQTDTQDLSITVQTPPPTLTVSTSPGSTSVVITFGTPTLAENQSCDVVVSSAAIDPGTGQPVGTVANTTSSSGPATRSVTLSGLAPSTQHTAQVTCGTTASGSDSFTTLPAGSGSTASWKYTVKPHANLTGRSVAKVSVEYNLIGSAADTETASCASGCTLTLPLLTGQLYELRHIWMTAADAVVATSRKGTVAVP